jgi:hypothetical protein
MIAPAWTDIGFCRSKPVLIGLADSDDWTIAMIQKLRQVIRRLH